jgi:hypothetical protein
MGEKPKLFKPFAKTLMLTLATKVLRGNAIAADDDGTMQTRVLRRVAETLETRAPAFQEEYQHQRRQAEGDGLAGKIRNAILDAVLDGTGDGQAETPSRPSTNGNMTRAEALSILDLDGPVPTTGQIESAYSRLIKRVHPDCGGSNHFAKQANAAREILLGKRRT